MNRLADESSPYLRQHADNPVDWYAWGDDAFADARITDRPVLLSVGYSSCHWCHVMAHESFEDAEVAATMNEYFVNVKVDREERPDIDAIYMEATQAMTGQGGWPMTVFLTPDGEPFFAGTYFGKSSMPGHPSFVELIEAINTAWHEQRDQVVEQGAALREAIRARTHAQGTTSEVFAAGSDWLHNAHTSVEAAYDPQWGGFGRAPKFPQVPTIDVLLRSGKPELLPIVTNTLDAMASGGIYDQLGGGFHRYSVDAFWMVPHFEKMLYDQASLARVYVDAYLVTRESRYAQVATETIEYVLRDLQHPNGGWYSAEDADSEGEEGTFYIWRPETFDAAIGDQAIVDNARRWYGLTNAGNFEGSNILHRPERGDLVRSDDIELARRRLLDARSKRPRPGLDDKVLTEWNAMFLATLAYAAGALDRPDWLDAARRNGEFLIDTMRTTSQRWLRTWHEKSGPKHLAFANDYAWLVEAFTRLYEASGEGRWRDLAHTTANDMIELFWDDDNGGLFTTGNDAERLIVRSKDLFDGATPSSNSTAAVALLRLAQLTDDHELRQRAIVLISMVEEAMANHPTAFSYLMAAVDVVVNEASEIVIAGKHPELVTAVLGTYRPRTVLAWGEADDSALWRGRTDGAYVCRNYACQMPTLSAEELRAEVRLT